MGKVIFISGGVCSSLGKGLLASSVGSILEMHNYKISMMKVDPYFNVDAGTMSPYQHGEVYVTDDGGEADLDIGNYYRYTNSNLSKDNLITTGKLYQQLINSERAGDFLGKTVQMIPHATNIIKEKINYISSQVDILLVEIGGTVGDYESIPFLESARQIIIENPKDNILIHLTLVPQLKNKELKTKPTQHSVKELNSIGISPNILVCRAPVEISQDMKDKISTFTNVAKECVFSNKDLEHVYELPSFLKEQKLDDKILELLSLNCNQIDMTSWDNVVSLLKNKDKKTINIAIVGKYIEFEDNYKSIYESLLHASLKSQICINFLNINSQNDKLENFKNKIDGILIPGGFGKKGFEGKIEFIRYARESKIPIFGICLGMQLMCVEYARNVLNIQDANSSESNPNAKNPIISLLDNQHKVKNIGGSMRLGLETIILKKDSKISKIYKKEEIQERHRHRYEVNPKYINDFENAGLTISGYTKEHNFVESVEYEQSFGIGVQYHPEFLSKIFKSHPLFLAFLDACKAKKY